MIGTLAMSGSLAIRFRKRTMAALLSSMASSMLMSMIWAPFSTCWRATASASSYWLLRIRRAKALEPVTLVRSPMLTNRWPWPMVSGSRPDRRMGATGAAVVKEAESDMATRWGKRGSVGQHHARRNMENRQVGAITQMRQSGRHGRPVPLRCRAIRAHLKPPRHAGSAPAAHRAAAACARRCRWPRYAPAWCRSSHRRCPPTLRRQNRAPGGW